MNKHEPIIENNNLLRKLLLKYEIKLGEKKSCIVEQ